MRKRLWRNGLRASLLFLALSVAAWSAPVGEKAPDFEAKDSQGKQVKLSELQGKYVVLEWFNHQCPFVKGQYDPGKMQALQQKWTDEGVVWIAICSSAPGKQGHNSAEAANALTEEKGAHPTHVILDEEGAIGRLYDAKTTPHMFVISPEGVLLYNGAIDDKGELNYVDQALTEAIGGKDVSVAVTKSYGCSVKY